MIHVNLDDLYRPRFVILWMLLAFKAGYLNAAGFLATGRFVSHVTGFGTQVGISIAHEDYLFGSELLIIPIAFILGSSIPAWVLDHEYSKSKLPKFHYVQILVTIGLGILLILGFQGEFGAFSTAEDDQHDIVLIGFLCFILGMKNGLTTWATYGRIRTTHLTGLATDIGLHLPKLFRDKNQSRMPEKKRVNSVRVLTFLSFSLGSLISAFVFPRFEYQGLILPFLMSVGLTVISYISYQKHTRNSYESENQFAYRGAGSTQKR